MIAATFTLLFIVFLPGKLNQRQRTIAIGRPSFFGAAFNEIGRQTVGLFKPVERAVCFADQTTARSAEPKRAGSVFGHSPNVAERFAGDLIELLRLSFMVTYRTGCGANPKIAFGIKKGGNRGAKIIQ